ncbi:MAG: RluA family pseudouridine synthase [Deltaproteobacteria bacterium]|nr:RluA family pseudouridine synthase [Deltaproteobacteria bacterium]
MNRKPPEINGRSHLIIPAHVLPDRADRMLADVLSGMMTRSSLSRLIREGLITSDAKRIKPSTVLKPGQEVTIEFNAIVEQPSAPVNTVPHPVILFEDDHVIVLDKPAGLVVHPGAGTREPTLMDILVACRPGMIGVGEHDRWGIVHRLDKDTSGVMIVAKTILAHEDLSAQFKVHSVGRVYMALVRGAPKSEAGVIDKELGRSRSDRKRMSTVTRKGRLAVTSWRVKDRFGPVSLLEIRPETGRTHQIRVHLASVGLPILGDRVYGTRAKKKLHSDRLSNKLASILKRQALHAAFLSFKHPDTGENLDFYSDLPSDMLEAIRICRKISWNTDNQRY